jgi:hypothetical protein
VECDAQADQLDQPLRQCAIDLERGGEGVQALGHLRLMAEDAGHTELGRRALVGASAGAQLGVELVGGEHRDAGHDVRIARRWTPTPY